jgi:hypothetical protein
MRRVVQTFVDIWKAGRSGLSGVLKLMMTDFTSFFSGVMAAINLAIAAFNFFRNLFGGGEEGTVVNPARDRFLSQWGDPSNKGVGGAGWNLAALLTQFGAGEGGGPMFAALQRANTMALFRPAAQAIVDFLRSHGENAEMNFHSGGLVPGTGEVQATLLGGERVQSREEVAMFPDLLREQRGLREDINRFMEGMQRRVRDDVLLARGRA